MMEQEGIKQTGFKHMTRVTNSSVSRSLIEDKVKGLGANLDSRSRTGKEMMIAIVDKMFIKQQSDQNVLVHPITRGFAVPKTVRLRQSLSLNLFGVQTQITGIHLVDKNFKNQIT